MTHIPVIAIPTASLLGTPLCETCAHDALISDYSDTYKAFNGIRPRWDYARLETMTNDAIYAEINSLIEREEATEAAYKAEKAAAKAEEARIAVEGLGPKLETAMATALKELVS